MIEELHAALDQAEAKGDVVVLKQRWSSFFQTNLDLQLRVRGIGTIVIAGGSTDVGIASTVFAARDLDCNYLWQSSLDTARAAGIDDKLIAAIEADKMPADLSPADRLLFEFCYQLLRGNHHVSDASYETIVKQFGAPVAVQIAGSVGYVAMMAMVVNTFEVAPPPDDTQPAL